ncbi:MAG: DUF1330 domain-containing protein [Limibacillus sp.]
MNSATFDLEQEAGDRPMPKGYLVVFYREAAADENLAAYAGEAKAAIEAMGGKFIARGMPVKTFEAGQVERSAVVEFESTDAAIRAFESDVYQKVLPRLGVMRDIRVIEGT